MAKKIAAHWMPLEEAAKLVPLDVLESEVMEGIDVHWEGEVMYVHRGVVNLIQVSLIRVEKD
jgi:hypothetical protein